MARDTGQDVEIKKDFSDEMKKKKNRLKIYIYI
jgi:hypothetical protein